jgi:predicted metal-dependent hydrolase
MNLGVFSLRIIQFENTDITYLLTYKNVKNINLRIKSTGEIFVSANKSTSAYIVDKFVLSQAEYILKALKKFESNNIYAPKPKQYISGENFKLLGKYLKLEVSVGEKETVYSDGIYLFLVIKDSTNLKRKIAMVNKWLTQECKIIFDDIVTDVYIRFKEYGVPNPEIKVRSMKSRWGSCQPNKGIITLNLKLIESSRCCIEYVVIHEFCHFIHPNHSNKFYDFFTMMMPDWKDHKKTLQEYSLFHASPNY